MANMMILSTVLFQEHIKIYTVQATEIFQDKEITGWNSMITGSETVCHKTQWNNTLWGEKQRKRWGHDQEAASELIFGH